MPSSTRRRSSRQRTKYEGRSFAGKLRGDAPERSSKRQEAADAALAAILDLFESGELPARVAETVIARQEGTSPMASWSLGNQLLCLLAGTTDARGYRQWQEVGRHVVKGAKAVYILAPKTRKIRETDPESGEERERVFVAGFIGLPVFRYEDTDGLSIERPDYEPATFPPLFEVAERLGVSVSYGPFAGRFRGYYSPGDERVMLCSHDERTWFHEIAHAAHARILRARGEELRGGQVASQEIVAEVVAATLAKLFDLDPGQLAYSVEYVRSYASGGNPGRAAMRVLADVQAVLSLILETADAEAPAPVAVAA
jgi:antirestriction protein ArdC